MLPFAKLPTDWLARPRWLRLRTLLQGDRFWAAAGVYWAAYAESVRTEKGATVTEYGAGDDVATALYDAGLLDQGYAIPADVLRAVLPSPARVARGRATADRATIVRTIEDGDLDRTETENARANDAVPGLAPHALEPLRWLSANVAYVEPLAGLGKLLGERTAALGSAEVLRRLAIIHTEAGLDPGDAAGYIFGITDRFRPTAGGPADRDAADRERLLAGVRERTPKGPER